MNKHPKDFRSVKKAKARIEKKIDALSAIIQHEEYHLSRDFDPVKDKGYIDECKEIIVQYQCELDLFRDIERGMKALLCASSELTDKLAKAEVEAQTYYDELVEYQMCCHQ